MQDNQNGMAQKAQTVNIREMEIDDLAEVFHLGESLFTSDRYPFLYRTWDEFEVTWLFNTEQETCLVAEVGDQLAGFVLGNLIFKGSWTYGYIVWLGVAPHTQRLGVADRLVDRVIERMIEQGARYMLVDTDPENTPAVRFFTKKGFGNARKHVFMSMNLEKHDRYARLLARERERDKADKLVKSQGWDRKKRGRGRASDADIRVFKNGQGSE